MVNDIEQKEIAMDISTLQLVLDTLNGKINNTLGYDDYSNGAIAGLIAARNDVQYLLEQELLYRDAQEAA